MRRRMTCVSGRGYDGILMRVHGELKQGGTAEVFFALDLYKLIKGFLLP